MPGDQQRHQLVAQLLGGHRRLVLVPGGEQHGEHVSRSLVPRSSGAGAALLDQLEDQLVRSGAVRQSPRTGPTAHQQPGQGAVRAGREETDRLLAEAQHLPKPVAQRVEPGTGLEPNTARRMISRVSR